MAPASHDTPDIFTASSSGGAGLSRRQIQGTGFRTPTAGVRIRADLPDSAELRIRVTSTARPDATLTDVSAAMRWRLPLPPWLSESLVSAAVPAGEAHVRRTGVRGRRLLLPPEHVTEVDGLRITTPARTWLDCSALIPLGHSVAMGDDMLRRRLASFDEMKGLCHWGYRRRGVAVARRSLTLLDERSASPGESLARVALVTGGIPWPECNVDIIVNGEWLALVDFLWREHRVIAEYDGAVHLSEEQRRKDAARRNLLQEAGFYVIVFTARDLRFPEQMCATVRAALTSRNPR